MMPFKVVSIISTQDIDITDEYIVLAAVALLRSRCSICVVYTKTDLDVCALFISKTLDKQTIICYTIFVIKLLLL
jgi:hypothetical protein